MLAAVLAAVLVAPMFPDSTGEIQSGDDDALEANFNPSDVGQQSPNRKVPYRAKPSLELGMAAVATEDRWPCCRPSALPP